MIGTVAFFVVAHSCGSEFESPVVLFFRVSFFERSM